MKYLQSISPFQIITAFTQRNNKENLERTTLTLSESENNDMPCSYEEAEQFLLRVGGAVRQEMDRKEAVRRKISIFEKIEVEPHYLEPTSTARLVEF